MKLIKTSNWVRLRGQIGSNNEVCKLDSLVTDKERVFFVPETDDEKTFFSMDMALNITNIPQGPTAHNPDEPWGWRFFADKTEHDMELFANSIKEAIDNIYNTALEDVLNSMPKTEGRILN